MGSQKYTLTYHVFYIIDQREHQLEDGVWRVRKNKDNGMLVAAIYYSHKYEVLKLDGYS